MNPPPENPEKEDNETAEKQTVKELTDEEGASVATNQETTSQDQLPKDVLATQYKYINNSEYAKAYALFAAQSRQLVSLEQYEAYFENNAPYSIDDYSFLSTNVSGNVGSVVVNLAVSSSTGEDQYQVTQQLVSEDGRWRVVMRDAQVATFISAGSSSASSSPSPSASQSADASATVNPSAGGAMLPISEDDCPPSVPIKGNVSSSGELIYHTRSSATYDATHPEECFATEAAAQAAGYRAARD